MEFQRSAGQVPFLPGAVRAGGLVYTSGVVAASCFTEASVPFEQQAEEAMTALLDALAGVGAGPADVVKVEAFLARADDFAVWNERYATVWPVPGPARTTTVIGFAMPAMLIELQAVAVIGD